MPMVHPFAAVRYPMSDLSAVAAPPYDVLDAASKARLLERSQHNVVTIDLPHTPPSHLGPSDAYSRAGETYRDWLRDGVLQRDSEPGLYLYRQRFVSTSGESVERCGVCCCIDAVPFGPREGGGVLPHEETFGGPKNDRLALMKAARAQFSPILGLHPDESGLASQLIRDAMSRFEPTTRADLGDGVVHETWNITDGVVIRAYQDALRGDDVFIADGHHRYTTHLNHLADLERLAGQPLEQDHPVRKCMFVLISMRDAGLEIWPTHRVLGGMKHYSFDALLAAGNGHFRSELIEGGVKGLAELLDSRDRGPIGPIGLHDYSTGRSALISPRNADPLKQRYPDRCSAWRELDVAYVQHVLVEAICSEQLNAGNPVTWSFPHTIEEVARFSASRSGNSESEGSDGQLAILLRPTPITSVRDVSRAGDLMPQKSTYFYPKLATGFWINPLEQ